LNDRVHERLHGFANISFGRVNIYEFLQKPMSAQILRAAALFFARDMVGLERVGVRMLLFCHNSACIAA